MPVIPSYQLICPCPRPAYPDSRNYGVVPLLMLPAPFYFLSV